MVHKNLAYGIVTTAPSPATSGTSLVLDSGEGARFPQPSTDGNFYITVFPEGEDPTPANAEICEVTARSTDTLTIVREQRDTSARTVVVGDRVIQGIYAEDIGLTSIVRAETPGGSINGSNTTFTVAGDYQTGSLRIYQNGIRLQEGASNDYEEATGGFTMNTAPATGDILLVDYETNNNNMSVGTNSFITNETPSGTVDGSNDEFTIANTPVSGTLQLFRDGQLLTGGGADYSLSGTTITFTTAPVSGSVLLAFYQYSVANSANADTVDGLHASYFFQAPQGYLLNGKIVPSVSSDNLTVALKTLAGNDPSSSDPVYCRIGDTVRQITSALSVTKNAGTNWFNSGSSELATFEIDYFVYLGYNDTDGVTIGFSRIIGRKYEDFSATTTDEKYCAISTITNADADDYYEVVGRFASTLSAGAGYTWTVPTFDAGNLIQHPVNETRILEWQPTYSGSSSLTYTSVTEASKEYKVTGDRVYIILSAGGTTGGTTSTTIGATMPFTNNTDNFRFPAFAGDSSVGGGAGYSLASNVLNVRKYDASNWGLGTGRYIAVNFSFKL